MKVLTFLLLLSLMPKVQIKLNTSACFFPCTIEVTLRVAPAADNDMVILVIEAEDSGYYRLSQLSCKPVMNLDGTFRFPPPTTKIQYKDVPAGHYTVRAGLVKQGKDSIAGLSTQTITVI